MNLTDTGLEHEDGTNSPITMEKNQRACQAGGRQGIQGSECHVDSGRV